MATEYGTDRSPEVNTPPARTLNIHRSNSVEVNDRRPTQKRIRVRIPKNYHQEPIISRLISHHGLTVNIAAALLGANARDDGWFDLELHGSREQIQSGLIYLDELDLEVWHDSTEQEDGW
jgi:ABC-type methionine transport system ATPase subunit